MKTAECSSVIRYAGQLCEVIGHTDDRVLFIRPINATPCPHCGEIKEYSVVERSPQFQENAKPVKTLVDTRN